jgi:hypothetical protein
MTYFVTLVRQFVLYRPGRCNIRIYAVCRFNSINSYTSGHFLQVDRDSIGNIQGRPLRPPLIDKESFLIVCLLSGFSVSCVFLSNPQALHVSAEDLSCTRRISHLSDRLHSGTVYSVSLSSVSHHLFQKISIHYFAGRVT